MSSRRITVVALHGQSPHAPLVNTHFLAAQRAFVGKGSRCSWETVWYVVARYITPLGVILVFINSLLG
ncbi:hypothetical protein DU490_01485 [Halomonas sp. DQ26W]|nr:hypothetical protein DU490_01485 [Halomonas sp. DQ26W]